ncbi:MFS transporter [Saccharopolyspora cebuensis]|uniref:MFS transporter n=1 Tax=Saccharopolyspora cebuensis TaxID=418759 RepID=A0ABV4CCV7_9PSEU
MDRASSGFLPPAHRVLRDHLGRPYRVGESPRQLAGRSRTALLWACRVPVLVVGTGQYAFGAAVPALTASTGRTAPELLWALALWTVFQAGAAYPVARRRPGKAPRAVLVAGALLSGLGLLALARAEHLAVLLIGYSALGGTGAGLVYAACTATAGRWFPERSAARVASVTGAFAWGSAPFAVALALDGAASVAALPVLAGVVAAVVLGCGLLLSDPPPHWWPEHVDPRRWALAAHPGRFRAPPAVRQFSAVEALRTPVLPVMAGALCCAATVSLFNAAVLAVLAVRLGHGPAVGALAVAAFAATGGAGRALAIPVADRLGGRRALRLVMAAQAFGQVLLLLALPAAGPGPLLVAALVAGIGGGAFYPLFAALARECFGDRRSAEVHGLVYSAKAVSGLLGIGLAVAAAGGSSAAPVVAAALSGCAALLVSALHRPGLPRTLPTASAPERAAGRPPIPT